MECAPLSRGQWRSGSHGLVARPRGPDKQETSKSAIQFTMKRAGFRPDYFAEERPVRR
jgi:hypothetical protein